MNLSDHSAGVLCELLAEAKRQTALLEAIAERIASPQARALRRGDRDRLGRMLPVIAGIYGDAEFETWEVLDLSRQASAEGRNLHLALGKLSAHKLGMLFRRAARARVHVGGIRVERAGRGADGARWRLSVT